MFRKLPKAQRNGAKSVHPRELRDNVVDANNKFFYAQATKPSGAISIHVCLSIDIEVTGVTKERHGRKNDGVLSGKTDAEERR
jgi:hypothetical protein